MDGRMDGGGILLFLILGAFFMACILKEFFKIRECQSYLIYVRKSNLVQMESSN